MAKRVFDRISLITTKETMNKIIVRVEEDGTLIVIIYFHGVKCAEAHRIIMNIIALINVPFTLDIRFNNYGLFYDAKYFLTVSCAKNCAAHFFCQK